MGAFIVMFGMIILMGLISLLAGLGALCLYAVKRRRGREFAVIGVTNDRRGKDLQKRGNALQRALADAALEQFAAERAEVRAKMRLIASESEPDYRLPEVFRRQAD
jgi:hypothetical protein